jgi:hypothetical protein
MERGCEHHCGDVCAETFINTDLEVDSYTLVDIDGSDCRAVFVVEMILAAQSHCETTGVPVLSRGAVWCHVECGLAEAANLASPCTLLHRIMI